jgi:hypothetical protein
MSELTRILDDFRNQLNEDIEFEKKITCCFCKETIDFEKSAGPRMYRSGDFTTLCSACMELVYNSWSCHLSEIDKDNKLQRIRRILDEGISG